MPVHIVALAVAALHTAVAAAGVKMRQGIAVEDKPEEGSPAEEIEAGRIVEAAEEIVGAEDGLVVEGRVGHTAARKVRPGGSPVDAADLAAWVD